MRGHCALERRDGAVTGFENEDNFIEDLAHHLDEK